MSTLHLQETGDCGAHLNMAGDDAEYKNATWNISAAIYRQIWKTAYKTKMAEGTS
jgi:hypothetical protein